MFTTTDRTITAEQVRQAFLALGQLEGLAAPSRDLDPVALGDAIAAVLHAAAREASRRERRLDAARSHRRTVQLARRGEVALLPDNVVAGLFGDLDCPPAA